MGESVLISVVIPSANRWSFIRRSVACALAQRGVDVEVLVATDGERDRTPPADAPELADRRVRLLQSPERRGVCRARNVGIAEARGAWLAFLDDDDVWAPDKLRRQVDAVQASGAGFAYTSAAVLEADLDLLRIERAPAPEELAVRALQENPLPAGASNVLARTDLARAIGGFDERLMHFGDWDFELRLIEAAPGAAVDEVLTGYVFHESNMHVRQLAGVEDELAYFTAKHAAAGRRIGSPQLARWIAGGYRQAGRRRRAAGVLASSALRHRRPDDLGRAAATLANLKVGRDGRDRPGGGAAADATPEWIAGARAAA